MFKGKISVIGAGFVGSSCAYTLMLSGLAREIVLVDINKDKAEGDILDMRHGVSFVPQVKLSAGGYRDTDGSDIIIITAGAAQKQGESRTDLLKRNVGVFKSIIDSLKPYFDDKTILLVVTNPVDILTYITAKLSGLPKERVIGSGTVLDTSRLKYLVGTQVGVDPRSVHTYIIGEHGDSEVAAWSTTTIAGMRFGSFCKVCECCGNTNYCKQKIFSEVKDSAYTIIDKKGATYYAVALAVRRIVECIAGDEKSILTVSGQLNGEYGIHDMAVSVPVVLGGNGIERVLDVDFDADEINALRASADSLKALYNQL